MVTNGDSIEKKVKGFRDLVIYQLSLELAKSVYKIVSNFPAKEKYVIQDQILRAVNSVGANIAEGHGRYSSKEFIKFLYISRGSLNEVLHFLILSNELKYIEANQLKELETQISNLGIKINNLISAISTKNGNK